MRYICVECQKRDNVNRLLTSVIYDKVHQRLAYTEADIPVCNHHFSRLNIYIQNARNLSTTIAYATKRFSIIGNEIVTEPRYIFLPLHETVTEFPQASRLLLKNARWIEPYHTQYRPAVWAQEAYDRSGITSLLI